MDSAPMAARRLTMTFLAGAEKLAPAPVANVGTTGAALLVVLMEADAKVGMTVKVEGEVVVVEKLVVEDDDAGAGTMGEDVVQGLLEGMTGLTVVDCDALGVVQGVVG